MEHEPPAARPIQRRRFDPLGLWLCGLAALGLARAWMYLVRDSGSAGAIGWVWLGGSILFGVTGLFLLARAWMHARRHAKRD